MEIEDDAVCKNCSQPAMSEIPAMSELTFLGSEGGDEVILHNPCGQKMLYSELPNHTCPVMEDEDDEVEQSPTNMPLLDGTLLGAGSDSSLRHAGNDVSVQLTFPIR